MPHNTMTAKPPARKLHVDLAEPYPAGAVPSLHKPVATTSPSRRSPRVLWGGAGRCHHFGRACAPIFSGGCAAGSRKSLASPWSAFFLSFYLLFVWASFCVQNFAHSTAPNFRQKCGFCQAQSAQCSAETFQTILMAGRSRLVQFQPDLSLGQKVTAPSSWVAVLKNIFLEAMCQWPGTCTMQPQVGFGQIYVHFTCSPKITPAHRIYFYKHVATKIPQSVKF